jgi:starch-binding outer membrane protein, SusD/RagB family
MKNMKLLIILSCVLISSGCNKLDIAPLNMLTDNTIIGSKEGVDAYMSRLYQALPIEDYNYAKTGGFNSWNGGLEGLGKNTGEFLGSNYDYDESMSSGFGYWPYDNIRQVNYLIENLPEYKSQYNDNDFNNLLGEAHFIRAYYYFGLVKRYGGVPILKETQKYPTTDSASYMVSRNKEDEVYTFISDDLDTAMQMLNTTSASARANKYVAAALKSRAMLFAGSIAKYGTVKLDGIVGIPREKAVSYFKESYAASKVVEEGPYQLYRANSDKVQNYVDIFFDQSSPENIFVKQFSRVAGTGANWEIFLAPAQLKGPSGYGSGLNPTVEFAELFGGLKYLDANGKPIRFDKVEDLLPSLEPRLRAIVLFPGEEWLGQKIDVLGGVYESYPGGILHQEKSIDVLWNGMRLTGLSGIGPSETTKTGFFMRKYLNYKAASTAEFNWGKKEDHWIDMRFAEVLLNKAEAACELAIEGDRSDNYLDEAMNAINDIRNRAGAEKIANSNDLIDINIVRLERRKELAFENHTWWDLRRWRIADKLIDHKHYQAFAPYYIYDEKKYIFLKSRHEEDGEFTFDLKMYYEPIPQGEINKDPNLLPQNPLW